MHEKPRKTFNTLPLPSPDRGPHVSLVPRDWGAGARKETTTRRTATQGGALTQLQFLYGALDSHPFFPSHVASGRCVLWAAAAGAPAGVVSAFAEPSGWCAGAVLDVAGAVCAVAVPSSPTQCHTWGRGVGGGGAMSTAGLEAAGPGDRRPTVGPVSAAPPYPALADLYHVQDKKWQINIRRPFIIEDGFDAFAQISDGGDLRLKAKLHIVFQNAHGLAEAGIDAGGVFKEFLTECLKQVRGRERAGGSRDWGGRGGVSYADGGRGGASGRNFSQCFRYFFTQFPSACPACVCVWVPSAEVLLRDAAGGLVTAPQFSAIFPQVFAVGFDAP